MRRFIFTVFALSLSSLSFAADTDICGKIQKVQQKNGWQVILDSGKTIPVFIGMPDGFRLENSIITTALASNLTVCFHLSADETLYEVVSVER